MALTSGPHCSSKKLTRRIHFETTLVSKSWLLGFILKPQWFQCQCKRGKLQSLISPHLVLKPVWFQNESNFWRTSWVKWHSSWQLFFGLMAPPWWQAIKFIWVYVLFSHLTQQGGHLVAEHILLSFNRKYHLLHTMFAKLHIKFHTCEVISTSYEVCNPKRYVITICLLESFCTEQNRFTHLISG